jgi:hypothetical protein
MDVVIAQLADPERLGLVLGMPVVDVEVGPYETTGWSGSDSAFTSVVAAIGDGTRHRMVLKTSTWESDWMMRGTSDRLGRAARIWQHGLLGRLPDEIDHATLAAWADDAGRQSILMRDVREELLDAIPTPPSTEDLILDAAAAMHTEFFEDPALADPRLGLCSLNDLYRVFAPDMAVSLQQHGASEAVDILVGGWELLGDLVEPDVRDALWSLATDPAPLVAALSRYPVTLVHDDLRPANMGVVPGSTPRLLVLDWARAAAVPPAVDLAWHVGAEWYRLPWPRESVIEVYGEHLQRRLGSRFESTWWEPQLRLAMLGGAVQFVGWMAWSAVHLEDEDARRTARDDLAGWWSEQVRVGLQLLRQH